MAFLVAPISFGILLFILSLFASSAYEGLWAIRFSALIGYPVAIVVGVPSYFLLRKLRTNGPLASAVLALLLTLVVASYLVLWPASADSAPGGLVSIPRIAQLATLAFASLFSTFTFWAIARPDRERKP
jgi:hypothetical protein